MKKNEKFDHESYCRGKNNVEVLTHIIVNLALLEKASKDVKLKKNIFELMFRGFEMFEEEERELFFESQKDKEACKEYFFKLCKIHSHLLGKKFKENVIH